MSRHGNGPGSARTKRHTPRVGEGTAWLVADRAAGDYRCYWYGGASDGRLQETATVPTAADAVAWGRRRTTQVRIRTVDGNSSWAGSAPRLPGMTDTWIEGAPVAAAGRAGRTDPVYHGVDAR